jgi:hypothetical protein
MCDRAGQLGESREYRMGRMRVIYFHIWSSEGGSPHLCQLRTNRLAPVNKIDYVLAHTRFMGSHKLSSFDGYVRGTHGLPVEVFTRVWWARLEPLIVVMNCGHS